MAINDDFIVGAQKLRLVDPRLAHNFSDEASTCLPPNTYHFSLS